MTRKPKLLICIPDFPFPARKNGISIRYYPIIKHAAQNFDIHLICIVDSPVDEACIGEAKSFCSQVSIYERIRRNTPLFKKLYYRAISLIPGNQSFAQVHYDEKAIEDFIAKVTSGQHYQTALCVLIKYHHLLKKHVKADRYTLDVIDSPYSTACRSSGNTPLQKYDLFITKLWERKAINSFDYTCYISPLDREIGAGKNVDDQTIGIIPNGIFLADYTEESLAFDAPTFGYLGNMGYTPNVRAALRLYEIFKAARQKLPNAKLVIIGRDPTPEIQNLANDPSVIVTGSVESIWPYVNGVDVFVFPMEIGSGQQNKLLEAMAAGKAVISSALGNSGVGASNAEAKVGNTDIEITNHMIELISNPTMRHDLGKNARAFIHNKYSWPTIFNKIDNFLIKII